MSLIDADDPVNNAPFLEFAPGMMRLLPDQPYVQLFTDSPFYFMCEFVFEYVPKSCTSTFLDDRPTDSPVDFQDTF